MPKGATNMSRGRGANDFKEKFQQNYINKYSLIFIDKKEKEAEIERLKAIVEEQTQRIGKLTSNASKGLVDVATQTDTIDTAEIEIQTGAIETVNAESQTDAIDTVNDENQTDANDTVNAENQTCMY